MLLLASASPARRRLLEQAGIPHRWQVSGVDEDTIQAADPAALVQLLARSKAEAVVQAWGLESWRPASSEDPMAGRRGDGRETVAAVGPAGYGVTTTVKPADDPGEICAVLGCDSLLCLQGTTFGKPADPDQARQRWQRLAGKRAELLTGHCLLTPRGRQLTTVATSVVFAPLSPEEIDRYVASGEPLACAGGFALEGMGGMVVERLEGCWSNVIGLSLPLLRRWLSPLGCSPLGPRSS